MPGLGVMNIHHHPTVYSSKEHLNIQLSMLKVRWRDTEIKKESDLSINTKLHDRRYFNAYMLKLKNKALVTFSTHFLDTASQSHWSYIQYSVSMWGFTASKAQNGGREIRWIWQSITLFVFLPECGNSCGSCWRLEAHFAKSFFFF